jgi:Right handed beta helix region
MLGLILAAAIAIPASGRLVLPAGVVDVAAPMRLPDGAHDLRIEGNPKGTVLRATAAFNGRAIILCHGVHRVRFENFEIRGIRSGGTAGLPPSNVPFARFYLGNGILAEASEDIAIERVGFKEIWGFPILISASKGVRIEHVTIADSGSKNAKGRNNTTGGILLEQGTTDFEVRDSSFTDVLGNGVWTHSDYGSPRNARGLIAGNRFREIGRDAIQVGHATGVRVEWNTGRHIGYPFAAVDVEDGATPVGVDTSGNVDHSVYTHNRFHEVNGKCIDLDGFHDGEVTFNTCVDKGAPEDYPSGHFGIVVNNWNPDMTSEHILIADNTIEGWKFGGIFLIGSHHTVVRNKLLDLNTAHCNENAAKFGCVAIQGQPDVLRAGIYLGRVAAEWAQKRADSSRDDVIRDNVITGYKMKTRCIMAAPGVSLKASTIQGNRCEDLGDGR